MFEFIKVPFGYLLDWLCRFSGNYGVALILFSLIIKVVLLPLSAKSKKSMLKVSRLAPQLKLLEIQCGDDKQKYQQEMAKLYKQEGVSMFGGCLWSFVPLLILIPLYYVIREPFTYLMHFTSEEAAKIVEVIGQSVTLSSNKFYQQLEAASFVGQCRDAIVAAIPEAAGRLQQYNFNFLGLNLCDVPDWKIWTFTAASQFGMFIVPLLSAGSQVLSMMVGQKMSNKVATDENGEADASAAATANQSGKTMMFIAPAMSLYFCFIMPLGISVYWIAQALFGTLQEIVLTKHYRKIYEAEDEVKKQAAAERALREAERERARAERRAKYGEEGIQDPNTSKKKLKQQAAAADRAAAQSYAAAQKGDADETTDPTEDKHFSGDPERPYCRGRAYKPNRYGRKDEPQQSVSET